MNTLQTQTELVKFNDGTVTGHWFARVKNTKNGREWIQRFREKNRRFKVTLYGRSPNRRSRCVETKVRYYPNYHKPAIADTIVVYLEEKSDHNKNIKINEYLIKDSIHYQVKRLWYDNGTMYLIAKSYNSGSIMAKWNRKKEMWVVVDRMH